MDAYLIHYVRRESGLTEPMLRELQRLAAQPGVVYTEVLTPSGFLAIFRNSADGLKASDRFKSEIAQRITSSLAWNGASAVSRTGPLMMELGHDGRAVVRPLGPAINEALFGAVRNT